MQPNNGFGHNRRQTFDASTEFENYANLFDDETREMLQKDDSTRERMPSIDDLKRNGIYQPPLVNDYEKEQILKYHADSNANNDDESKEDTPNDTSSSSKQSSPNKSDNGGIKAIIIDPGNTHFKQWHQSRRRTLDELESKGVLDPDFFNFDGNKQQNSNGKVRMKSTENLAISTKAQQGDYLPPIQTEMAASISAISVIDEDDDDYEDMELYRNDLYYVLCHQIIPKSQQGVFQQMLRENIVYNLNNPLDRNERNSDDEQQPPQQAEEEILADLDAKEIMNDEEIFMASSTQTASTKPAKVPDAPPPTAVATPYYDVEENSMGFNSVSAPKKTDIAKVRSKLERHSKKLEKQNMMEALNGELAAMPDDDDDDDDDEPPDLSEYERQQNIQRTVAQQQQQQTQSKKSQHFGAQRSIMSLMQNHHSGTIVPQNTPHAQFLGLQQQQRNNSSGTNNGDESAESNLFAFAPTVISEKQNPHLVAIGSNNNSETMSNDKYEHKNAFNISYYCIPSHIDGGILSSSIFLPYKQWCESSIIRYTEQAGECLDQMKKESNMLEHIHRTTITKSPMQDLYGDAYDDQEEEEEEFVGGGGGLLLDDHVNGGGHGANNNNTLHREREEHLKKLSQIDENLADIRDKLRKMFRVQQHITLIQQQYDTYIDGVREDKQELLDILNELRERHRDCDKILSFVRESEVWLITNIANTIAERSEKIDSYNRKIKVESDVQQKRRYSLLVESTKNFIKELHDLIQELQRISDNKAREVERLKTSIEQMEKQNLILLQASQSSYDKVVGRLFELQNHYKLPAIMESKSDINGQCHSITSSLAAYLQKVDCRDYYNRLLELHQASIIYSDERTKIFYNSFLLLINNIINDCMIIDEYVSTNCNDSTSGPQTPPRSKAQPKFVELDDEEDISVSPLPTADNNNNRASSKSVSFAQHVSGMQSSDRIIDKAFTPVQLNPSARSTSFAPLHEAYQNQLMADKKQDPHALLNHVLHDNEFEMKFESIQLLNTLNATHLRQPQQEEFDDDDQDEKKDENKLDLMETNLLRRIRILSLFGHLIPYKESVLMSVAQVITLKYKQQIYNFKFFDKLAIKQFATEHCSSLLANILFRHKHKRGVMRCLKRLIRTHKKKKKLHKNLVDVEQDHEHEHEQSAADRNNPYNLNIYRIAALIANCVYDIHNMPFTIT